MSSFTKAYVSGPSLSKSLGFVDGLKIIAIGPLGGKIVGYSKGKPVYAGSPAAKKLAAKLYAKSTAHADDAFDWLHDLGLNPKKAPGFPPQFVLSNHDAKLLHDSFPDIQFGMLSASAKTVKVDALKNAMGQPLQPHADKAGAWNAAAAAGVYGDDGPFSAEVLSSLKLKGALGGSHGGKIVIDDKGAQYAWKVNHGQTWVSLAEEAFNRVAKLVFPQPKLYADAELVEHDGDKGVLLSWQENKGTLGTESSGHGVEQKKLQKHFLRLAQHQVLDWLMSNHDSHGGNFLITPEGDVSAIDKGQAFKAIGSDKLSPSYKLNASAPVYNQMWSQFESGQVKVDKADIIAAVDEVMSGIAKLSEEQYKLIVTPYLQAATAGLSGFNAEKKWAEIAKRFHNVQSDFETFLSAQLGEPVKLQQKATAAPPTTVVAQTAEASLETPGEAGNTWEGWPPPSLIADLDSGDIDVPSMSMHMFEAPEGMVVSVKYPAGAVVKYTKTPEKMWVPDDGGDDLSSGNLADEIAYVSGKDVTFDGSKVAVSEAPTPLLDSLIAEIAPAPATSGKVMQLPGWPKTKGNVTVKHPGSPPSPATKWAAKFPGPGFNATINYKGKNYDWTFHEKDGVMSIDVLLPTGEVHAVTSPQKAADLMMLHETGNPLTYNSYDIKTKGLPSYAATKLLKLGDWQEDFANAVSTPQALDDVKHPASETVAQLEADKTVDPVQAAITGEQMIASMQEGLVSDTASMSFDLQLVVTAAKAGKALGPIPAGTVLKTDFGLFLVMGGLWKKYTPTFGGAGDLTDVKAGVHSTLMNHPALEVFAQKTAEPKVTPSQAAKVAPGASIIVEDAKGIDVVTKQPNGTFTNSDGVNVGDVSGKGYVGEKVAGPTTIASWGDANVTTVDELLSLKPGAKVTTDIGLFTLNDEGLWESPDATGKITASQLLDVADDNQGSLKIKHAPGLFGWGGWKTLTAQQLEAVPVGTVLLGSMGAVKDEYTKTATGWSSKEFGGGAPSTYQSYLIETMPPSVDSVPEPLPAAPTLTESAPAAPQPIAEVVAAMPPAATVTEALASSTTKAPVSLNTFLSSKATLAKHGLTYLSLGGAAKGAMAGGIYLSATAKAGVDPIAALKAVIAEAGIPDKLVMKAPVPSLFDKKGIKSYAVMSPSAQNHQVGAAEVTVAEALQEPPSVAPAPAAAAPTPSADGEPPASPWPSHLGVAVAANAMEMGAEKVATILDQAPLGAKITYGFSNLVLTKTSPTTWTAANAANSTVLTEDLADEASVGTPLKLGAVATSPPVEAAPKPTGWPSDADSKKLAGTSKSSAVDALENAPDGTVVVANGIIFTSAKHTTGVWSAAGAPSSWNGVADDYEVAQQIIIANGTQTKVQIAPGVQKPKLDLSGSAMAVTMDLEALPVGSVITYGNGGAESFVKMTSGNWKGGKALDGVVGATGAQLAKMLKILPAETVQLQDDVVAAPTPAAVPKGAETLPEIVDLINSTPPGGAVSINGNTWVKGDAGMWKVQQAPEHDDEWSQKSNASLATWAFAEDAVVTPANAPAAAAPAAPAGLPTHVYSTAQLNALPVGVGVYTQDQGNPLGAQYVKIATGQFMKIGHAVYGANTPNGKLVDAASLNLNAMYAENKGEHYVVVPAGGVMPVSGVVVDHVVGVAAQAPTVAQAKAALPTKSAKIPKSWTLDKIKGALTGHPQGSKLVFADGTVLVLGMQLSATGNKPPFPVWHIYGSELAAAEAATSGNTPKAFYVDVTGQVVKTKLPGAVKKKGGATLITGGEAPVFNGTAPTTSTPATPAPTILSGPNVVGEKGVSLNALNGAPAGSQISVASGSLFVKGDDGKWHNHSFGVANDYTSSKFLDGSGQLVSTMTLLYEQTPEQKAAKEKADAEAALKAAYAKKAAEAAKATAAKKAAEMKAKLETFKTWETTHQPGGAFATQLVTHMQSKLPAAALEKGLHVFQTVTASGAPQNVLIGGATAEAQDALKQSIDNWTGFPPYVEVDTPLGKMLSVPMVPMLKAVPTAALIDGPDGNKYPAGTTFSETTITTSTKQEKLAASGSIYKMGPHVTNPDIVAIKTKPGEQADAFPGVLSGMGVPLAEGVGANPLTGASTVYFVAKADLQAAAETKTITTPTKPPAPPTLKKAPLPFAQNVPPQGSTGTRNQSDLASISTLIPSKSGYCVRVGKPGVLRDAQLRIKRVKREDGSYYFEVHGELTSFNAAKAQMTAGSTVNFNVVDVSGNGWKNYGFDAETGTHVEGSEGKTFDNSFKTKTAGGSEVNLVPQSAGYYAMANKFIVRIEEGADVQAELAAAFTAMGHDPDTALGDHDDHAERVWIKSQVVRAGLGAKGYFDKDFSGDPLNVASYADEAWLDGQLAKLKMAHLVDTATIQTGMGGYQHVVINDATEDLSQVQFITSGATEEAIASMLTGGGMVARTNGYANGTNVGGASPGPDAKTGGASGTATRIHSSWMGDTSYEGVGGWQDLRVVVHPRVLKRADWWLNDGDNYMAKTTKTGKGGPGFGWGGNNRRKAFEVGGLSTDGGNECCFEQGLALSDFAGIAAKSESARSGLIATLKARDPGLTHINGVALEDFIFVAANASAKIIVAKAPGLKAGAL